MESQVHSVREGRTIKAFTGFDAKDHKHLPQLGIDIARLYNANTIGMDALTPSLITTANIANPVQFLQQWLPGFVSIVTSPLKAQQIFGVVNAGRWEDEEVIQSVVEPIGQALPYGDAQNTKYTSLNVNYERRTIVRFSDGMSMGMLEDARLSASNINAAAQKRAAAANSLKIAANNTAIYGYNGGNNRTYGVLNDPSLPAYVQFAAGASTSTLWSTKTYAEIVKDIITMIAALNTNNKGLFDAETTDFTMVLPVSVSTFLSVQNPLGTLTVREYLRQTYPRMRIETLPQFDAALAGDNVIYMFIDKLQDGLSTDDGNTWALIEPMAFKVLGVERRVKSYIEEYTNATAGIMCKRPVCVVRYYGC